MLMVVPLVPRVRTLPLLLAPPMVVAPMVAPLALAAVDASTSGFKEVDNEAAPLAILLRPVDSEPT